MEELNQLAYGQFVKEAERLLHFSLGAYKSRQMERRTGEWLKARGYPTYRAYLRALSDPVERERFLSFLTINTSSFFRDPEIFRFVEDEIVPGLRARPRVRVWSAACSIGAEPYSVAMILADRLAGKPYRVLATDIDEGALATARHGFFPASYRKGIPPRYHRYLIPDGDGFWVAPAVREAVRFQRSDLLTETPPGVFDLVLCRNVMIYWTLEAQRAVLTRLAQAVQLQGYLIVGSTEWVREPEAFGLVQVVHGVYRRSASGQAAALPSGAQGG